MKTGDFFSGLEPSLVLMTTIYIHLQEEHFIGVVMRRMLIIYFIHTNEV